MISVVAFTTSVVGLIPTIGYTPWVGGFLLFAWRWYNYDTKRLYVRSHSFTNGNVEAGILTMEGLRQETL